ncbi:SDR family oxidoreductase [Amycolatopsis sp. NEAU-NG30]|uniref:SDR family oxidoreductase n=1 Tax=Amycolatopsis melonis TaxID=3156488 RepID=A0ABV0LVN6_9PSEU
MSDRRIVLVTGGARGLGREISLAFAREGAHVIVNYFHARDEAPKLLEELRALGPAELLRASVADRAQVDAMFDTVAERHGRLDVLVNNAASGALLPLGELDESHWQRALDTNLRGSLWCARRAAPLLAGRPGAAIVNLSSLGSSLVISDYATVGTSKAAVEALTRYLAVEFAADGIRVNTASGGLLDGAVATMFPDAAALAARVRAATPLGHRLGSERELAELVLFLASERASWITGQTVIADGGLSLGAMMLSPERPENTPKEPAALEPGDAIAVVGMGVVTPGANDPDELWRTLGGDRHVFGEPALYDITSFHSPDPEAEDKTYTRQSGFITGFRPHPRLAAELRDGTVPSRESTALWLRHSLYTALDGVTTGAADRFFAAFGYTADGSQELEERLVLSGAGRRLGGTTEALRARYDRLGEPASEFLPHRVGRNAIHGLLPEETELLMVDTACSSALYSVDLGIKALRVGDADIAVCGSAFAYSARNLVLFSKLHGLSRSGEVRSFDRDANGVLFSDGAGVVVLKRLARARADGDTVLGILEGTGLSCDGRGKAIYAPNAAGQAIALRRAYRAAGTGPDTVGWVIAHATGTRAGDSTELASLHEVAADGPRALLSSNKPIVGHTGWSAGLVSLVQALQGLRHGVVPAQRYLRTPIPALDGSRFVPPSGPAELPAAPRRVAVSSFGFGGTNAHLVVTDTPREIPVPPPADEDVVLLGWSADVPGRIDVERWLCGTGPAPEPGFGDEYPLPAFDEVRLPPATLRNMDRTQIMLLRAAARLDAPVREACTRLRDTTGVVAGHMGPTRRAVHYALRCYLTDVQRCAGRELPELAEAVRALVPPSTEDAFPGIMPNIIPARLAAQLDLRGLNLTVDTGPDSGLDALRTAERHLRQGDLDLALVAGVNGNSTPELVDVLGDVQLAEGAFLTVLARESTAAELGLPILARIATGHGPGTPRTPADGPTYLGADPIVELLRMVTAGRAGRIGSTRAHGPYADVRPGVPAPEAAPSPGPGSRTEHADLPVERMIRRLVPAPGRPVRSALPAIPDGAWVVMPGPSLPNDVTLPASARLITDVTDLPDGEATHVRVLAGLGAAGTPPDDLSAVDRLRGLHDLAYLAAARWTGTAGASYAVLLHDAVRDGVPHPATGLFTGLVKSLAREHPAGLCFAVLADVPDLSLLERESRCETDLAVAVYAGGQRFEHVLVPSPAAGTRLPIGRDSVVVAAGGGRGLTAELLAALAERAQPEIYVLGRQAPGEGPGSRAEFLAARHRAEPDRPVAELSAEYDRLVAGAAVRRTLDRLTAHCGPGRVHHLVCDLTDPAAVAAAIDHVHRRHERVDLLINAAGVHQGGTVRATPLPQARRVRDTKVLAYLNLRAAFAGRPPRLWQNFGSLLAVLGWPGEAAYCAGNDLLTAAAAWRHAPAGEAETTIAWALWDQAGFAAEPLTRELLRGRGELTALSTSDGVAAYLAELATGGADREVTFLGAAERRVLAKPWLTPRAGSADLRWTPHPGRDGYLGHHLLKDVPTLPASFVAELAVQAATPPGRVPLRLDDVSLSLPVTMTAGRERDYHLRIERRETSAVVEVLSDLTAPGGRVVRADLRHASAALTTAAGWPEPVREPLPDPADTPVTPGFYGGHGPVRLSGPFASLADVRAGTGRATARFAPDLGEAAATVATLRTPALLVDALLQLALIAEHGPDPRIPAGIGRVEYRTGGNDADLLRRYGPRIVLGARAGVATAQAPDGTVLARVHGVRAGGAAAPAAVKEVAVR